MNKFFRIVFFVVSVCLAASCTGPLNEGAALIAEEGNALVQEQSSEPSNIARALYNPGEATVKFSSAAADEIEKGIISKGLEAVCSELGVVSLERVFPYAGEYEERTRKEGLHRFYQVTFDDAIPYEKAQTLFENLDCVDLVEGCMDAKTLSFNDTYISTQWSISGTCNINADYAWQYTTGDPKVVVCVVDHGIQQNHPDLVGNLGGINYNFCNSTTELSPGDHGTHVAGIIAAVSNNGVGIAGIAGGNYAAKSAGATLLSAQVFQGEKSSGMHSRAIKWGADNGALISQNSWGYSYDTDKDGRLSDEEKERALAAKPSESDKAAIDYFRKYAGCDKNGNQKADSPMKGGVVVFSAGNDGISNGVPASYAPVIAVGATTKAGQLASYSNYGDWVDICAPGSDIYSTITGGKYKHNSGTSMACPQVSGACALIISYFGGPDFTADDLEEILVNGAASGKINYLAHNCGPYLDLKGAFQYGIAKYQRLYNNDPVIRTEYAGDFVFRQYQTVDIPFIITDPDDDQVSVQATFEGRGNFVHDSVADSIWHFNLVGELVSDFTPKKAKITVTDRFGGKSEYSFTYQVLKNNAPEVSGAVEEFILTSLSTSRSVDLNGLFTDPDGENLTISAKVSPAGAAKVSVDGDKLTVTPLSYGLTTVTLSAVDLLRDKAQTTFRFLTRPGETDLEYYPNPVTDFLYLRTGLQPETIRVRMFNSASSCVFDESLTCSAFDPGKIDMTSYAPGIYVLDIEKGVKNHEFNIVRK